MLFITAHLQKTKDSCWGVSVPALGGCFGAGDTIPKAIKDMTSAITAHLQVLWEEDDLITIDTAEPVTNYKLNKIITDTDGTKHVYKLVPVILPCSTLKLTLLK